MNEVLREFLLETHESLAQLDLDLVKLEKVPGDTETIPRVFRALHTVKGSAGFLGLPKLQAVAHAAENLLSKLRAGEIAYSSGVASALLASIDAIRKTLDALEKTSTEGTDDFGSVIERLEALLSASAGSTSVATEVFTVSPPPPPPPPPPVPVAVVPPPPSPPPPVPAAVVPPAPPVVVPHREPSPPSLVAVPHREASPPSLVQPEPAEPRAPAVSDSALRVDVGLLDQLMTLVGELVLARNQIVQFSSSQENGQFLSAVQRLNLLTTELQANVLKTRMQPIGNMWGKFPRVVRDLAMACGKRVRLDMDGTETELDKTIVEAIRDPLTHLVRNAVDHGIETPAERAACGKPEEGRLSLKASHEGGKVIIQIVDDGRGIDPARVLEKAISSRLLTADQAGRLSEREVVELIFLPGFSTTDRVTHFSGRGVGMDVVRTNVEKIGGTVDIATKPGQGTTLKMKIPLTLAIIPALTITSGGDRYAIPQVSLLELVRVEGEQAKKGIERIHGASVYRLRGNLLPLVDLNRELQIGGGRTAADDGVHIVVLQADDRQFGLIVDAIHDTEEIVVKPLQKQIKGAVPFAGATIMDDGRVALILDVHALAQRAHVVSGARERAFEDAATAVAHPKETVLLFTTRSGSRMAVPLEHVARLEEFPRSALERIGSRRVVQYRGQILPLVDVAKALGRGTKPRPPGCAAKPDAAVPVVVYTVRGRAVGLIVGRILDIVEEAIEAGSVARRGGIRYAAVVQDKVTEFLDVEALVRAADPGFFDHAPVEG